MANKLEKAITDMERMGFRVISDKDWNALSFLGDHDTSKLIEVLKSRGCLVYANADQMWKELADCGFSVTSPTGKCMTGKSMTAKVKVVVPGNNIEAECEAWKADSFEDAWEAENNAILATGVDIVEDSVMFPRMAKLGYNCTRI